MRHFFTDAPKVCEKSKKVCEKSKYLLDHPYDKSYTNLKLCEKGKMANCKGLTI